MECVIELNEVTRKYTVYTGKGNILKRLISREKKEVVAIDKASLTVSPGEIIGYVGPNGAGKSTTIKLMTGVLKPSKGTVKVLGVNPQDNRYLISKKIGVVFGQKSQLWWDLPVKDSFTLLKAMYAIPDDVFSNRLTQFDGILGISELLNTPVRQLSLGQRMKCDLTASMLHNPQILFLDEPTIGLDAASKENFRIFIKQINQQFQTTIILTSHDLQDIANTCKRLLLLDKGKLLYDGQIADFTQHFHSYKKIRINTIIPLSIRQEGLLHPAICKVDIDADQYMSTVVYDDSQISSSEIFNLLSSVVKFDEFTVSDQSIESVIANYCKNMEKA